MRFELSTTIGGHRRLTGSELERIADRGFRTIDVSLPTGNGDLGGESWLAELQHAAAAAGLETGGVSAHWSLGSLALARARTIGAKRVTLIADACRVHAAGAPAAPDADKLGRALEPLAREAADASLTIVVEFPRAFDAATIGDLLDAIEGGPVGACLDVGHAQLSGDPAEAIEALSGYITLVHVHDNSGREDTHRAPYSGSVDWPLTLMALWKTGFAGSAVIEMAPDPDLPTSLTRAVGARTRLQAILDDLAQPMVFPE